MGPAITKLVWGFIKLLAAGLLFFAILAFLGCGGGPRRECGMNQKSGGGDKACRPTP